MAIYYEKENMSKPTITAECEQVKACISINRPIKWENVYNGYPKKHTALYDMDLPPGLFQNACATRVSIALIKAEWNNTIRDFESHFTDYGGNIDKDGVIYFWELK